MLGFFYFELDLYPDDGMYINSKAINDSTKAIKKYKNVILQEYLMSHPLKISLNSGDWALADNCMMRSAIPASVPGDIHADLQKCGRIPELYYGLNSRVAKDVSACDWYYQKKITIPSEWRGKTLRLCFAGVDYACEVSLNGCCLGCHEGQFTPFNFEITKCAVFGGENMLSVKILRAPPLTQDKLFIQHGNGWPHHYAHEARIIEHKFLKTSTVTGWDWGTPIYSMGIWQNVDLVATSNLFLENIQITTKLDQSYKSAVAYVKATSISDHGGDYEFIWNIECLTAKEKIIEKTESASLQDGKNEISSAIQIQSPKLWNPAGYGEQNLYRLTLSACLRGNNTVADSISLTFGIRELQAVQNPPPVSNKSYTLVGAALPPDKADYKPLTKVPALNTGTLPGKSPAYLIVINGKKIFGKGANWVPGDLLYGTMTRERYEHLIKLAAEANINLFRLWGGGLVEKQDFYELCDKYGIMVFQELPFGGCRPAEDTESLKNTEKELRKIIPLLTGHPSVVRYCFGNELYLTKDDSRQLDLAERLCDELDPSRPFYPPDPFCETQRHGPHWFHYREEYTLYNTGLPLTIGPAEPNEWTEFGASAMPCVESLARFIPKANLAQVDENDPVWEHHHAFNSFGKDNWLCRPEYVNLFGNPPDLETEVRLSQFMQSEGLRYACQSMRRKLWRRSACAIWSYNEPWPNAAHGCFVDYYGIPKMAYYYVKKSYSPIDASIEHDGLFIQPGKTPPMRFWAVNQTPEKISNCTMQINYFDLAGALHHTQTKIFDLKPETSVLICDSDFTVPDSLPGKIIFAQVKLISMAQTLSNNIYVFASGSESSALKGLMAAPKCELSVSAERFSGSIKIVNRSVIPALFVRLKAVNADDNKRVYFSDNYFIIPGGSETIVNIQSKRDPLGNIFEIDAWNADKIKIEM